MHTAVSKGAGSQGAWPWPRPFLAGPRDEGCLPRPALQAHAASENRHSLQPSKPPGREAGLWPRRRGPAWALMKICGQGEAESSLEKARWGPLPVL